MHRGHAIPENSGRSPAKPKLGVARFLKANTPSKPLIVATLIRTIQPCFGFPRSSLRCVAMSSMGKFTRCSYMPWPSTKSETWRMDSRIGESRETEFYVIPGYKRPFEIDRTWRLANSKGYVRDFGKVLEADPKSPRDIVAAMAKLSANPFEDLIVGWQGAFGPKRERYKNSEIRELKYYWTTSCF